MAQKADLIPEEAKTTLVHLDMRQREAVFRDFAQREALFRDFAAYQGASGVGKVTAQDQIPLDAKESKALFQEFAHYQKIHSVIVAYHDTSADH
jgi:hypothetical protein